MVVVDADKIDDLELATQDSYILDLYRIAAHSEDMGLREFLLKYKLAKEK